MKKQYLIEKTKIFLEFILVSSLIMHSWAGSESGNHPNAPICPGVKNYRILKDNINPKGTYFELDLNENFLFAACSRRGLLVYNLGDPAHPVYQYTVDTLDARSVRVRGKYAYIADGTAGLKIIDLQNKKICRSVSLNGTASGIDFYQQYALIAAEEAGLHIVDIAKPWQARLVSTIPSSQCSYGIAAQNDYAFIADGGAGLKIFDLRDPLRPVLAAAVNSLLNTDVAVRGHYAFMADPVAGVKIIDFSNLADIQVIKEIQNLETSRYIFLEGNRAYIADGTEGIVILSIENMADINIVQKVDTEYAQQVIVRDGYAYVAEHNYGLKVIDLLQFDPPKIVHTLRTNDSSHDLAVRDGYAYVANQHGGFQIIDVRNPKTAGVVKVIEDICPFGVALKDHFALASCIDFFAVDISNIGQASVIKSIGEATGKNFIYGDYCFVTLGCCGIKIYNIRDVLNATLAGETPAHIVSDCYAQGDYLYIATGMGLRIMDIKNIQTPTTVSVLPLSYSHDVEVRDGLAYVADDSGFHIVDVTDVANPVLVKTVETNGAAYGVDILHRYAYVANIEKGLQIIDIAHPQTARIIKTIPTSGLAHTVKVIGKKVYLLDELEGLLIIGAQSR